MRKTIILATVLVAFVAIGVTIWFRVQGQTSPMPIGAGYAPGKHDTTGGQEMRPRWDSSEGQSHDAPSN
ncbi:MAG: hypothetical protein ABS35_37005 [Kaistia sp. SCN 65-12]|nr:MAG: hypothetical protein ABS35_37005 [Kaistia sp. SCN 65-12]